MGNRVGKLLITTAFCLLMLPFASSISQAETKRIKEIEKEIEQLEKQQEELKNEQSELTSDRENTKEKLNENKQQQQTVQQEMVSLDQQLLKTQEDIQGKEQEIEQTTEEINTLNDEIDHLKEEIEDLIDRIDKREELMKDRLVSMQKNGGSIKYLEVILGAQSFGDFISRTSAVSTIIDQDQSIVAIHTQDKEDLETKQTEVEEKRDEVTAQKVALEEQREELVALKSTLDRQMSEKETLMAQLEQEHEELHEYVMGIEEQEQALRDQEKVISQLRAQAQQEKTNLEQLAEERRKKEEEERRKREEANSGGGGGQQPPQNVAGGSGVLNWPAQGKLSSTYGYRSFNGGGFHYGIDIAAPTGTPVYASASGVVTRSNYSPSYGNVIYIYHPELDLTTVYAHLSERSVSLGQTVSSNQLIGKIGNTGHSFGAHLHFETHRGRWSFRSGIDPMQFLK